ncbi:MAG: HD domain-containing protein [Gemmataceae bacterium]
MTDTQDILRRIAALRARLDQAHGLLEESDTAVAEAPAGAAPEAVELAGKTRKGERAARLIDAALRPLVETEAALPVRLTARSARLLHQGRDLLQTLRQLAEELGEAEAGPRCRLHRETTAILDSVLRTVQAFPPAASAQLRLCEGLEATLEVVEDRVKVLRTACANHREEDRHIERLASLFRKLASGQTIRGRDWRNHADELLREAKHGAPLRWRRAGADDPFRCAAAHGLNVAQTLARLIQDDPEWQAHLQECLLAALVHDIGMVHVPHELLTRPLAWTDAERRHVERHTTLGAEMLAKDFPAGGIIVEAAQDHHERLDGSGYPQGKKEMQIGAFTRLLAICDVYAARCSGRPHRPPQDTRTALTETLLEADQGKLDRLQAEKLLRLSFYPPGSVVELADGAAGVVVATHPGQQGLLNPSKPILLLFTESQGQPLALPRLLDLMQEEERSILRALPAEARASLLGRTFPELV